MKLLILLYLVYSTLALATFTNKGNRGEVFLNPIIELKTGVGFEELNKDKSPVFMKLMVAIPAAGSSFMVFRQVSGTVAYTPPSGRVFETKYVHHRVAVAGIVDVNISSCTTAPIAAACAGEVTIGHSTGGTDLHTLHCVSATSCEEDLMGYIMESGRYLAVDALSGTVDGDLFIYGYERDL